MSDREVCEHGVYHLYTCKKCDEKYAASRTDEITNLRARLEAAERERDKTLPVMNMLVLCGEQECVGIDDPATRLRALIDGLIAQRRARAEAEAACAVLREEILNIKVSAYPAHGSGMLGVVWPKDLERLRALALNCSDTARLTADVVEKARVQYEAHGAYPGLKAAIDALDAARGVKP